MAQVFLRDGTVISKRWHSYFEEMAQLFLAVIVPSEHTAIVAGVCVLVCNVDCSSGSSPESGCGPLPSHVQVATRKLQALVDQ